MLRIHGLMHRDGVVTNLYTVNVVIGRAGGQTVMIFKIFTRAQNPVIRTAAAIGDMKSARSRPIRIVLLDAF
jgi:hypothetical protein